MTNQYLHNWREREKARVKTPILLDSHFNIATFAVITLALFCITARDGLTDIYHRWAFEEEYGYGFLVVPVVLVILWRRWPSIRENSFGPSWHGLLLVAVSQFICVLGALAESYFIEQIAFVAALLGFGLTVLGFGAIRFLGPLSLLLTLAIPLPYTLQAMLTVKLQLLSTEIGVAIIRLLGIPVFVEGNIIDLGTSKLQVAEACSGLRYLLPLCCMSLILAILYKASYWKKFVLVASAAPITILINSVRIAVVAVLVDNFGSQMADGFLHQFEGWIVFLIGTLLLGTLIFAMQGYRLANVHIASIWDRPTTSKGLANPLLLGRSSVLVTMFAALAMAISLTWSDQAGPNPQRQHFADFPRQINDWKGHEEPLDPSVAKVLKATDYYVAEYSTSAYAVPVNLFIVYYESLNKGAAIHSPRVCLPGTGWEFAHFEERNFGELQRHKPGTFNRVIIQKGEQKILMHYWFQQRDRSTANEFTAKYYVLADRISTHRKDGALIRVHTPIYQGRIEEADERLRAFSNSFLPILPHYVPL